jgi:rubrerythrin
MVSYMIRHLLLPITALLGLAVTAMAILPQKTIDNLTAAYRGETNAKHRYTLFAQKADAEGYPQVALLFRAAAQAEAIHRERHRNAIFALGDGVAAFPLDGVKVGTTAANLEAAIKGESYEGDSMYPQFLTQAILDNATPAVRSLTFASTAESKHAKLYQEALNELGHNAKTDYYVCSVCGYTVASLPGKNCPSCHNGSEKVTKFSL